VILVTQCSANIIVNTSINYSFYTYICSFIKNVGYFVCFAIILL